MASPPATLLSVEEAARLLGIAPATVRRWARQGLLGTRLPETGEIRFERRELEAWARSHGLRVRADAASGSSAGAAGGGRPLLQALRRGSILPRLEGDSPQEVLHRLVEEIPAPPQLDRKELLRQLLERESLSTTGLGHGVALPHPRTPSRAFADEATVHLAFLARPVDWKALDGEPVHTVFLLLSPDSRSHLRVLARLAFLLRDPAFQGLLARHPPAEEILDWLEEKEPEES